LRYVTSEDVFKEMTERIGPFKGMTYVRLGSLGQKLSVSDRVATHAVSA
jgi:hypothetical protein